MNDDNDTVPRSEFNAVLRMLVKRATLKDRLRAWRRPNHWLHKARREMNPKLRNRMPRTWANWFGLRCKLRLCPFLHRRCVLGCGRWRYPT